jgi:O-antigen/teichoic acid export membrane protein
MGLARGTGLRLASYGAGGLLSLLALPLIVRHLGVADFGRYVAVLSVVSVAALVSDLGITTLALREYTSAPANERPALMQGLLGMRLLVSVLGALAAIGFVVAAGYPAPAAWGAAVACAGLVPQVYADLVVVSLLTASRFGRAAAIDFTRSAAGSVILVALVVAGAGLVWFLAAYAAAALAGALMARLLALEHVALRPRLPSGRARRLLGDSIAYAVATAVYVVYFRAVMLVVSLQATPRQAGWFASAFRITEFVAAAAAIAASTATPALVRAAASGAFAQTALRLTAIAAGAGTLVGGVIALAAPLVMRVLGGAALEPAAGVLRVEAIATGLVFPVFMLGAALLVLRRHAALVVVNALGLAVAVAGALLLVPGHGARGGAIAAAIAEAVLLVAQAVALVRASRPRASARAAQVLAE